MHRAGLLHKWMRCTFTFMHAARVRAVGRAIEALLVGGRLTLTELGRARPGTAFVKHAIKAMDRLLGNPYLAVEREKIYAAVARVLLGRNPRPVILIDWADCNPGHRFLMLRAAVAVPGRSVSLYEEVHPLSRYNAPRTHRRFLEALSRVLPPDCRPILVTDAGFRGPWFQAVEKLGWDWVGRVRNKVKCSLDGEHWTYTEAIYRTAATQPRYLGHGALSHKQPYGCHLYLLRAYVRGPGRPKKIHRNDVAAQRCRKLHKDPWLIATSLPHTAASTRRVFALYASRMKIEEGIRDTKSHRFGFAMNYARSENIDRLQALLIIGLLATLACCLHGLAAKENGLARRFQANTERRRTVLSIFFLGRHLLRSCRTWFELGDLEKAFHSLPLIIAEQQPLLV